MNVLIATSTRFKKNENDDWGSTNTEFTTESLNEAPLLVDMLPHNYPKTLEENENY